MGHGKRHDVELEQIPEYFYPLTGKNQVRGTKHYQVENTMLIKRPDLHKIYYDDKSYNQGHGHAYEFLGINPNQGAIVVVRPDQCVSSFAFPANQIIGLY